MPGTEPNLKCRFSKQKDSNPKFITFSESQPDNRYPADSQEELLKNGLLIREAIDGGLTVIAPARRNLPVKIVLGLFCLIWDGISVLIWLQDALWLFRIGFPACGVLITLVWSDLLLRSSRFHVDSHEFTWRNGWPLLAREQRVEVSEVTLVEAGTSMQSGNTQYYKIVITRSSSAFGLKRKAPFSASSEAKVLRTHWSARFRASSPKLDSISARNSTPLALRSRVLSTGWSPHPHVTTRL